MAVQQIKLKSQCKNPQLKQSFIKASKEEDINGDGKKDYIIKVETSPHWDGSRHFITYADVDGDGKYDYLINETVPNYKDPNGNVTPPNKEVHNASDEENRSMKQLLQDLMNPNPNGEKMKILDISF